MSETNLAPAPDFVCFLIEGPADFEAFGFNADMDIGQFAGSLETGKIVVRLGPDQWLCLSKDAVEEPGISEGAALFRQTAMRSWFTLAGPNATPALASLGPRDLALDAFPTGTGGRARLGPMTVILLRTGPEAFLIGVPISFEDYAGQMLAAASEKAQA